MSYLEILSTAGAATLADDAAFDLTNDAEWRFDVSFADWSPAAVMFLADRFITTGTNRNWRIRLNTNSNNWLDIEDGAGAFRLSCDSLFPEPAANERAQLRLTLDADNGSTQTRINCYSRTGGAITDLEDDTGWTLEETSDFAGVQAWKATTNLIRLGCSSENLTTGSVGLRIYRALHWSDISKTTKVFDVTFDDATQVDANHWDDAARAGDWLANGTENTDWRYEPGPDVAKVIAAAHATASTTTGTTGWTATIPALTAENDIIVVVVESRNHTSGTAFVAVADDKGNTYARKGSSTQRRLNVFWARAVSGSAGGTITVSGAVDSSTGGVSVFRGALLSGDPLNQIVFEENASGNEAHAGFTPSQAGAVVCFGVGNHTNDTLSVTVLAAATLGTLEPEYWSRLSSGGSDCYAIFTGKTIPHTGSPAATGNFTWSQTNSATDSVSFEILPEPLPSGSVVVANLVHNYRQQRRRQ